MRQRRKVQKKVFFILTAEERKHIRAVPRFSVQGPNKISPLCLTQRMLGGLPQLVEGSLEDESDVALLTVQLLGTERAGGVEGVCAVRQRDLIPEGRRLL